MLVLIFKPNQSFKTYFQWYELTLGFQYLPVVIMASRIEQLNKEFDSQVLISEDVIRSIGPNMVHAKLLGEIPLKGLEYAPLIYKVA